MPAPITAVIFDMDGVLVDGEPLHFAAARSLLAEYGAELREDDYRQFIGQTVDDNFARVQELYGVTVSQAEYQGRYTERVLEQYRNHSEPTPGARALLESLRDGAVPCGLASSSLRVWVETALDGLGLREFFAVTVAGDEVSRGKPEPEIYLAAASQLGVAPESCLVIEDAPAGIAAGRAAGMRVVGVRTEMTAGLSLEGAERIIDSLEDFELEWLSAGAREGACAGV